MRDRRGRFGWGRAFLAVLFGCLALLTGCSAKQQVPLPLGAGETLTVDAQGHPLDAHDGQLVVSDGHYVLIGTAYDCGFRYTDPAAPFCGFGAYTSSDLVNWHPTGPLFDATTGYWQKLCAHGAFGCYRPHEIYLAASHRWVLWVNVPGGYRTLTSAKPTGPFAALSTPAIAADAAGLHASAYGDEALAVDPVSGAAYVAYTAIVLPSNAHDIIVQRLDASGTQPVGSASRLGQSLVEAPSLFTLGGAWWLTYSDPACPYCSGTGTSLARAPAPLGHWQVVASLTKTSCGGQPAAVDVLSVARRQQVLYQSDLWDHGDSNEARARTYLAPLRVAASGQPGPVACEHAAGP